jgi:hypothetical protein
MIYDTLKLARHLEPAFSREQAEALTTAIAESTEQTLVTRQYLETALANLKVDLIKGAFGLLAFNLFGTAGLVLGLSKLTAH